MIEGVIEDITNRIPPSDGDNLLGFEIDCDNYFNEDDLISAKIIKTGDVKNMLRIELTINEGFASIQNLSHKISEMYQMIEYSNFSLHGLKWLSKELNFRFITIISNDQFCVSGTIIVKGEFYEKLYKQFKKDFPGSMFG